jgi:hypothetical protein
MPKDKARTERKVVPTSASDAFLRGLHGEFVEQVNRYHGLTAHLLELEARVELAEKQLCLTRDHFKMVIEKTEGAIPHDWETVLKQVRFVGVRIADACVALLSERKKMTPVELLDALNRGMFRFRTNTPLREIHAALLRQQHVKRIGDVWIWEGPDMDQMKLTLLKREKGEEKTA